MRSGPLEHSFIVSPSESLSLMSMNYVAQRLDSCFVATFSTRLKRFSKRPVPLFFLWRLVGTVVPYHTTARESCVVLRV